MLSIGAVQSGPRDFRNLWCAMAPALYPSGVTTLAEVVKQAREARQWSVRELGRRAGVSHAAVLRVENGERLGRADTVSRITEALGIDPAIVSQLLRGEPVDSEDIDLADPELKLMFDDVGRLTPEERESVKAAIRLVRRIQRGDR